MRRLRVLTYNVQFRSWGMEAGAQGSLTPYTSVEERAKVISERILASPEPWDVLCFNEVFDEDGREALAHYLGTEYPSYVYKADADDRLAGALELAGGLLLSGTVWGLALGLLGGATLLSSRWEDSGLMLFSKRPFAMAPLPPEAIEIQKDLGIDPVVRDFARVAFVPYEDAEGNDASAAKGVLYAELDVDGWPFHILMSHTQADSLTGIGEHESVRRKQFGTVMKLLEQMVGPPEHDTGSYRSEILFCGDLNVQGYKRQGEWKHLFDTPGAPLTKVLQDAWTFEQCPGRLDIPGAKLLPRDCDPGLTTQGQRLDYVIRPRYDVEKLVAQHIRIAHDVAQAVNSTVPTQYTSDHLPLSIDLYDARDHNTALTAEPLPFASGPDEFRTATLERGEMRWYRIDSPGGYGFAMTSGATQVAYEVYTADEMSRGYRPYSVTKTPPIGELPPLTRYALAESPFFVRVYLRPGVRRATYHFVGHRFEGASRADAIPLLRSWPAIGAARHGALHSQADPEADHDTTDCVWFDAQLQAPPAGVAAVRTRIELPDAENLAFGLLVFRDDGAGGLEFVDEAPAGANPVAIELEHSRPGRLYVLARREDTSYESVDFRLRLDQDVTYLYTNPADLSQRPLGGSATLLCIEETGGLGSDDIGLNVHAPGLVGQIPNSDAYEFDDDTRRDAPLPTIGYQGTAEIELVEFDDTSPADRTNVKIGQHGTPAAATATRRTHQSGPTFRAAYPIRFSDGYYELEITVSPEPPVAP